MFSRDCVGCDTASAAAQMTNPYYTPRLGGIIPHDLVRFNASAEMRAPYGQGTTSSSGSSTLRRDLNVRPRALNRLRETEQLPNRRNAVAHRYEDPSYENVHVQWQNGFEFGRSRDYEHTHQHSRPHLQRARSESPSFSNHPRRMQKSTPNGACGAAAAKYADPFKNYELNAENNTFRPKLSKVEMVEGKNDTVFRSTSATGTTNNEALRVITPPAVQPVVLEAEQELEGAVGGANISENNTTKGDRPDSVAESHRNEKKENGNLNTRDSETDAAKTATFSNIKSTFKEHKE